MNDQAEPQRISPGPGQQSVWDFPRIPKISAETRRIRIYVGGIPIVNTTKGLRVMEYGHPPTFYVPTSEFKHCEVRRLKHQYEDEHKGTATYFTIIAAGKIAHRSAWSYMVPHGAFRRLQSHLGVYAGRVGRAYIDNQLVEPEDSDHFAGWITSDIVGPYLSGEEPSPW